MDDKFRYERGWYEAQGLMMMPRNPLPDLINLRESCIVPGQALCHRCVGIPVREASTPLGNSTSTKGGHGDPGACAGCGNQLREGQALVALDRQWHVWCFKCHSCNTVLHGEYMGK